MRQRVNDPRKQIRRPNLTVIVDEQLRRRHCVLCDPVQHFKDQDFVVVARVLTLQDLQEDLLEEQANLSLQVLLEVVQ
jgi:hypothetical protein